MPGPRRPPSPRVADGASPRSYREVVDAHRMPVVATAAATAAVMTAAPLAAAGIAATMLLAGPGGMSAVITVALTAVQAVLLLVVRDGAVGTRRFLLAWTGEAGLTYLVAGTPGIESALVYLGVGLVFATVVVAGLALWRPEPDPGPDVESAPEPGERRGGTQPLPVVDGDG